MDRRVIDLYGMSEGKIEQVASLLTQAAGLLFQRHSSEVWGDYYRVRSPGSREKINLKENYNPIDGELTYPEYRTYPLVIEVVVESIARSREIEKRILSAPGIKAVLLNRREYPKQVK
ncbi:MAG TPA: hypothetical protein VFV38_48855 [Ktedonobacteraceae bacterium]|nr:hypothetical protein [Ktedonobacteraceae bacterium]